MHAIRELTWPIVYHSALGALVALAVWTSGAGLLRLGKRALRTPLQPVDLLLAYPAGLLAVVATAFVGVVDAPAGIVALLALAALCTVGIRGRAQFGTAVSSAAGAALRSLPFVLGYSLVCGFLLHGATHDLDSHPLGDNATWVSETIGVRRNGIHIPDLTVLGDTFSHLEAGPPYIAAALSRLVHVDFYLAGTSLLTTFVGLSLAAGLGVVRGARARAERPEPLVWTAGVALVAFSSIGYAGWIPESPPVALALPLGFTFYWLVVAAVRLRTFVLVAVLAAAALTVSKVLTVAALVGAIVVAAPRHVGGLSTRGVAAAAAVAAGAVGIAVALAYTSSSWSLDLVHLRFLPYSTLRQAHELVHVRRFQTLAPLAQLFGIVALVAFQIRRRRWLPLAMILVTLAPYWLLYGQNFRVGFDCALLVAAAWELESGPGADTALLVAAGVLLALGDWWFDPAQSRGSFAMCLCLAAGMYAAARPGRTAALVPPLVVVASGVALALAGQTRAAALAVAAAVAVAAVYERRPTLPLRAPVSVTLLVVLAAASGVELVHAQRAATANFGVYDNTIYTHDTWQAWRKVAHLAGSRSLVFTSATGPATTASEGWDYYPAIGERQIYLAGWANSSLTTHRADLNRRLALNSAVLAGARAPRSLPGTARYDSFFAVVSVSAPKPAGFHLVYRNDSVAVYRISAG